MYADFYGFKEPPFSITPDPRFLYLNGCYQEALAALTYGIDARKGFISLVGEAGTGKTTLLRRLLDTLDARTRSVLLLNPSVAFDDILEHILFELGIPTDGARKLTLLQRLNDFLIEHTAAGGNVVLLIDEAQDLSLVALEELRLLSNLETAREKILQIVLAGQPELERNLVNPALRQLRQRIALHVRLRPLSAEEVVAYVRNRLERAGASRLDVFSPPAVERVATLTRGIPRLVNVLCDAALLMAFVQGAREVTPALVDEAWRDYAIAEPEPATRPQPAPAAVPAGSPGPGPMPTLAPRDDAAPDARVAPSPRPVRPATPGISVAEGPPFATPGRSASASTAAAARATPRMVERSPAPADSRPHPPTAGPRLRSPSLALHPRRPDPRPSQPASSPAPRRRSLLPATAVALLVISAALYGVTRHESRRPNSLAPARPSDAVATGDGRADPPAAAPAPTLRAVTAEEARTLVGEFRAAYEARDVERLVDLFAEDASENGRTGREAIAAAYRATLDALVEVSYVLSDLAVENTGGRVEVRAPFHIRYVLSGGGAGEVRGVVAWTLERRDGRARIVTLGYRLAPST
jgi:general secretion pathway protein A